MTIKVTWHNADKTILRWDFDGRWSWEDYAEAQYQSNEMIGQVDHIVDVIGEVRNSPDLPANAILGYRRTLKKQSPQIGIIVLVGTHRFVQAMVKTYMKYYPSSGRRFRFANSLTEAQSLIVSYHQGRVGSSAKS